MDEEQNVAIVKKLMEKGFGFLEIKGRKKDIFFHASNVKDNAFVDLREGDKVSYEGIEMNEKGEYAFGIKLLN